MSVEDFKHGGKIYIYSKKSTVSVSVWFAMKMLLWWKSIMSIATMRPSIRATHCTPVPNEYKKFKQTAASLQAQQQFFCAIKVQENATAASYEVAKLIAQHGKPFSDGDFIKQCLIKVTEIMCPEKVQDFNNVSLSRITVVRRIEDLSANLKLACDESTDATQLLIFFGE